MLELPPMIESDASVRPLTPEEIQRECRPDYEATGNPLPDPATSTFLGVFKGGDLLGYLCLQVKLHAQPLVIRHGQGSILPRLIHEAEKFILERSGPQWVYAFVPAGKLSQIAQTMGMTLEPWNVLSKLVAPEVPPKDPISVGLLPQVVDSDPSEVVN